MRLSVLMFSADMENPTPLPTATERYASIRDRMCARLEAEGARYSAARMVDLLLLELLTWMIAWCVNRDEQRLLEQACQVDVVAEPELAGGFAATGGDKCRGDASTRDGRVRAVVREIAPAPAPGATDEDCVRGEGRARAVCRRWHPVAMGRGVSAMDRECQVFPVLFAKTELRTGWNRVDLVTYRQ